MILNQLLLELIFKLIFLAIIIQHEKLKLLFGLLTLIAAQFAIISLVTDFHPTGVIPKDIGVFWLSQHPHLSEDSFQFGLQLRVVASRFQLDQFQSVGLLVQNVKCLSKFSKGIPFARSKNHLCRSASSDKTHSGISIIMNKYARVVEFFQALHL